MITAALPLHTSAVIKWISPCHAGIISQTRRTLGGGGQILPTTETSGRSEPVLSSPDGFNGVPVGQPSERSLHLPSPAVNSGQLILSSPDGFNGVPVGQAGERSLHLPSPAVNCEQLTARRLQHPGVPDPRGSTTGQRRTSGLMSGQRSSAQVRSQNSVGQIVSAHTRMQNRPKNSGGRVMFNLICKPSRLMIIINSRDGLIINLSWYNHHP